MSSAAAQLRPDRLARRAARRALTSTTCVRTTTPAVALTFDDGPDPRLTPRVLDVLRERQVSATFLLVAQRVREHPELARRVVAEGHEVGLHGDSHVDLRGVPLVEQYRALQRGRRDVEEVLGVPVRWFRAPYGKQEPETLLACRALRLRPLMWSTSGHDWEPSSLHEQLEHVAAGVRPGAVVLLHDGAADVVEPPAPPPAFQPELLERLLDVLVARGLEPVTISRLIAAGRPVRAPWFEQWLHH
jgi:peptidoglycan/xylan/chitin deacetylase (PgdA/CDA1 family)